MTSISGHPHQPEHAILFRFPFLCHQGCGIVRSMSTCECLMHRVLQWRADHTHRFDSCKVDRLVGKALLGSINPCFQGCCTGEVELSPSTKMLLKRYKYK
nr:hypothetical protein CFP56_13174 [Quercus suber]